MTDLRAFLFAHRRLAAILLMAALFMKAAVPAGFMPRLGARVISIEICADSSGGRLSRALVIPQREAPSPGHQEMAKGICPFAGLTHAGLAGADPILLAAALCFIMLVGLVRPAALPIRRRAHLRPPLRGPPAAA